MSTPEQFAWAAGFFDGEGYIHAGGGIRKRDPQRVYYTHIHISIGQKDRRVLDRFQQIFAVGHVYGPYTNGLTQGNEKRTSYRYEVSNYKGVKYVVDQMLPYLSEIKTNQCTVALHEWLIRPRRKSGRKLLIGPLRKRSIRKGVAYP